MAIHYGDSRLPASEARANSVGMAAKFAWTATYDYAASAGSIVVAQASNIFFQGNRVSGSSGPVSVDKDSTSVSPA